MLLYEDHRAVVYALAFAPDGAALASGAKDGALIVRDAEGRACRLLEPGPKTPAVHAIAYLPDGAIVIGHATGWHIYHQDRGVWQTSSPPTAAPTTSLAVLDRNLLAVGTGERLKSTAGKLEIWDVATKKRHEPYFEEPNGVRAVAACPAKNLVAWATGHRQVKVWDIRRQAPAVIPQKNNSPAVALSPDGAALAAAGDWAVRLYDLAHRSPRERLTLQGHKGQVAAVAFSPDGSTVATGSWDQTVRLWDVASGREKGNFRWPIGRVYSLAYAPDGLRLAAGGDEARVVVWDVE